MTPEQFCYWLRGWDELNGKGSIPDEEQWMVIKQHLASVFLNVINPVREIVYAPNVDKPLSTFIC